MPFASPHAPFTDVRLPGAGGRATLEAMKAYRVPFTEALAVGVALGAEFVFRIPRLPFALQAEAK